MIVHCNGDNRNLTHKNDIVKPNSKERKNYENERQ